GGPPLVGSGAAAEGPAQPADVVAEVQFLAAQLPVLAGFLTDDQGLAGGHGQAAQRAAGFHAGQEERQEGGLAGLPLAGEQGDVAGGQVALPQPGHGRRGGAQVAGPEDLGEGQGGRGGRRDDGGGGRGAGGGGGGGRVEGKGLGGPGRTGGEREGAWGGAPGRGRGNASHASHSSHASHPSWLGGMEWNPRGKGAQD